METKICQQCNQPRPISNFKPSTWQNTDGSKKNGRSKICRKCERNARSSKGLCNCCGRNVKPGHTACEECLKTIRESAKRRSQADRITAIQHYGGKCQYCGEIEEIFLTIDHINNDGAKHRLEVNKSKRAGSTTYAWLRRNNYPDGFQVLCYNCNCTKTTHGELAVKEAAQKRLRRIKLDLLTKLIKDIKAGKISTGEISQLTP